MKLAMTHGRREAMFGSAARVSCPERSPEDTRLKPASDILCKYDDAIVADELTANLLDEMNHPLSAIFMNAQAALQWLTRDVADLEEAKKAIERIVGNGRRAADVLRDVRNRV
jgi:anthranilate phosphoribosyltransferase